MADYKHRNTRLETFKLWPKTAPIAPSELAEAGFYYNGEGDQVKCAWCKIVLRKWNVGEIAIGEHTKHAPKCLFLAQMKEKQNADQSKIYHFRKRDSTDNTEQNIKPDVSIVSNNTAECFEYNVYNAIQNQKLQHVNDCHEPITRPYQYYESCRNRINTFFNWQDVHPVSGRDLALAGFFYTDIRDKVKCALCKGEIENWQPGDVPIIEHIKNYPHCQFLRNYVTHLDNRLSTFCKWPEKCLINPKHIAEAGMYYTGYGENVKCAFCSVVIKSFRPGDDPVTVHLNRFPSCPFLQELILENGLNLKQHGLECIYKSDSNSESESDTESEGSSMTSLNNDIVREWMESNISVCIVGDLGYDDTMIDRALHNILSNRPADNNFAAPNSEEILDAIYTIEDEDNEPGNNGEDKETLAGNLMIERGFSSEAIENVKQQIKAKGKTVTLDRILDYLCKSRNIGLT